MIFFFNFTDNFDDKKSQNPECSNYETLRVGPKMQIVNRNPEMSKFVKFCMKFPCLDDTLQSPPLANPKSWQFLMKIH